MEFRKGISGSAVVFVGTADTGGGQSAPAKHYQSTEWKTDSAGQSGMDSFLKCLCNLFEKMCYSQATLRYVCQWENHNFKYISVVWLFFVS